MALLDVKGLKGAKAAQLLAAMEIARRVSVPSQRGSLDIKSTSAPRRTICGSAFEVLGKSIFVFCISTGGPPCLKTRSLLTGRWLLFGHTSAPLLPGRCS
jgi:hypothetical protein